MELQLTNHASNIALETFTIDLENSQPILLPGFLF